MMIRTLQNLASRKASHGTGKRVLMMLERCFDSLKRQESIMPELKVMSHILRTGLELDARPEVYGRLNYLVGAFLAAQERSREIYRVVFDIMTEIKEQIEQNPQRHFSLQEKEWAEFEKSVYLLSDWEDLVFADGQSCRILSFC